MVGDEYKKKRVILAVILIVLIIGFFLIRPYLVDTGIHSGLEIINENKEGI